MTGFFIHNMAPIMFGSLVLFLLLGYSVAFSLAALGLFYGVIGIELGLFEPNFLQALPQRVFGTMASETLLAVPFFTFMGMILEKSGMAEKLLDTVGKLFGPVRGGLAYAVIFVGALLAATTGVVAASVIAMGLISLPIMLRYGYSRPLASGTIAASGTLAQIIPPSLVLILLAEQLGKPVGDLYYGAVLPGLLITGLYAVYVLIVTIARPAAAPALPADARSFGEGADYPSVLRAIVLPLALMVWAMVILFVPDIGFAAYKVVLPFMTPVFDLVADSELWSAVTKLGMFAAIYLVYWALLRWGPLPFAQIVGAIAIGAAIYYLVALVSSLHRRATGRERRCRRRTADCRPARRAQLCRVAAVGRRHTLPCQRHRYLDAGAATGDRRRHFSHRLRPVAAADPHLPGARHHLPRHRHANRRWSDGSGRRDDARAAQWQVVVQADPRLRRRRRRGFRRSSFSSSSVLACSR